MAKRIKTTERIILYTREDRAFIADFEKSSKAHVAKVTRTRESARQELVDAGIYNADGTLHKNYRTVA